MKKSIPTGSQINNEIEVPGDKSITHRAVLFSALTNQPSVIYTNTLGRDNFASIRIISQLGASITMSLPESMYELAVSEGLASLSKEVSGREAKIEITSNGPGILRQSESALDCGNSGTTSRLLCGILAPSDFSSLLIGDESLQKRPFDRIVDPLSKMGVSFDGTMLPLTVTGAGDSGGMPSPLNFESKKSSAQVKSAILLAGIFADGETSVTEPVCSRDHTERMLEEMGVTLQRSDLSRSPYTVTLKGNPDYSLKGFHGTIPGDISAAMFFIVAGLINQHEGITIKGVGVNPTRNGMFSILKKMNARFELREERIVGGEPVADIFVQTSSLKGVELEENDVARAIDEIPILAVLSTFAEGQTVITGASELRVKESDRITMTVSMLRYFGMQVEELEDGMKILGTGGNADVKYAEIDSSKDNSWMKCGDHRILMAGAILSFSLFGYADVYDIPAIETSFPTFLEGFSRV